MYLESCIIQKCTELSHLFTTLLKSIYYRGLSEELDIKTDFMKNCS